MKTEALVDPATLRAARDRAGLDVAALAARLDVTEAEDRLRAWEAGRSRPSFTQARKLAAVLRVPFASLFLGPSTLGSDAIPDLRTIGARRHRYSVDLLDVYHDALRKQAWVRDVRQRHAFGDLTFVGSGRGVNDPVAGARTLRAVLGLTEGDARGARDTDEYFRLLVTRAEAAGILVLRSSTVGSNTHRPLSTEEFRGFAIADTVAPLVFVNTADAKAAQVFTLIHEIAHVWRAETGVSQPALEAPRSKLGDAEASCDRIAAELLVPEDRLRAAWTVRSSLRENAEALRRRFKVSGLVVARRALDAGLVSRKAYTPYVAEQMRLARSRPQRSGAPSPLVMVAFRNGATVVDMVSRAVRGGEMLWRDASALLGVSPRVVGQIADQSALG